MKCKENFIYFTIKLKGIGGKIMERISLSNVGDTKFQKLLGHNPEILHSWSTLENTLYNKGTLSAEQGTSEKNISVREMNARTVWQREGLMICKR